MPKANFAKARFMVTWCDFWGAPFHFLLFPLYRNRLQFSQQGSPNSNQWMKSELKLNNTYTVMYSASIPITLEITGSLKHSYMKEIKRWSWLCCFMVTLSGCCSSFHSSSKNDRFCKSSQGFVMFPVLTERYSTTVQNCEEKSKTWN